MRRVSSSPTAPPPSPPLQCVTMAARSWPGAPRRVCSPTTTSFGSTKNFCRLRPPSSPLTGTLKVRKVCSYLSHSEPPVFSTENVFTKLRISPCDAEGHPVEPMMLPKFLETHHWDRPSCFCVMQGSLRRVQLLVPTRQESPAFGMMCLACPDLDCPYFGDFTISRVYLLVH